MAEGQYTSTERVYVDKDGKRVDAKDPARHRLLVAAGGSIPMADARAAGLTGEEEAKADDTSDAASDDASDTEGLDAKEESARVQGKASKKSKK